MKSMKCFKVKVVTSNNLDPLHESPPSEFNLPQKIQSTNGAELTCTNGYLYVMAESFVDIEKLIPQGEIISMELLGHAYSIPQDEA